MGKWNCTNTAISSRNGSSQAPAQEVRQDGNEEIVVVVGSGSEAAAHILHASQVVEWSDRLSKGIHGGWKESRTRRFEFPHRDPWEFEKIMRIMTPTCPEQITRENLPMALDWLDELESPQGLEMCDQVLCSQVITEPPRLAVDDKELLFLVESMEDLLDCLDTSYRYSLPCSKDQCLSIIKKVLLFPHSFRARICLKPLLAFIKTRQEDEGWYFPLAEMFKSLLRPDLSGSSDNVTRMVRLAIANGTFWDLCATGDPANYRLELGYCFVGGAILDHLADGEAHELGSMSSVLGHYGTERAHLNLLKDGGLVEFDEIHTRVQLCKHVRDMLPSNACQSLILLANP